MSLVQNIPNIFSNFGFCCMENKNTVQGLPAMRDVANLFNVSLMCKRYEIRSTDDMPTTESEFMGN